MKENNRKGGTGGRIKGKGERKGRQPRQKQHGKEREIEKTDTKREGEKEKCGNGRENEKQKKWKVGKAENRD